MRILRFAGVLVIMTALVLFVLDLVAYFETGRWAPRAFGRLWNELEPSSLQLLQPAIERYLWPPLWSDLLFPLLRQQASLVLLVLGLIFWFLGRSRNRRVHRR